MNATWKRLTLITTCLNDLDYVRSLASENTFDLPTFCKCHLSCLFLILRIGIPNLSAVFLKDRQEFSNLSMLAPTSWTFLVKHIFVLLPKTTTNVLLCPGCSVFLKIPFSINDSINKRMLVVNKQLNAGRQKRIMLIWADCWYTRCRYCIDKLMKRVGSLSVPNSAGISTLQL